MISNRLGSRLLARLVASTVVLALLVCGCATQPTPQPGVHFPDYVVGAPDALTISVLPEPAIVEQVVVRPDGKITMQLIGEVQAAGRTPREIGVEIEERIARFKRGARASVSLTGANSSAITVFGEVRSPGTFVMTKQTRAAELLGTAGGPTPFANLDSIHIIRAGEKSTEVIPIDLSAIREGDLQTNVQVFPGDLVYVPPTMLARVGYVILQILFPFQPLFAPATTVATFAQ